MKNYIGVDVGKLELHLSHQGKITKLANTEKALQSWLSKNEFAQLAIWIDEPTGGYEYHLRNYLCKQSISQRCVHANHIRYYAKSKGILAKTDKIDAKIIESYANTNELTADDNIKKSTRIAVLMQRREQVIQMRRQEKNRLENTYDKLVINFIKKMIDQLNKQVLKLDGLIDEAIDMTEGLKKQRKLYESVPGVL